jgi:hypothetical protein
MEPLEKQIVAKACELSEALRDAAYTRKEDDKKRVSHFQMELMQLCQSFVSDSSSGSSR